MAFSNRARSRGRAGDFADSTRTIANSAVSWSAIAVGAAAAAALAMIVILVVLFAH